MSDMNAKQAMDEIITDCLLALLPYLSRSDDLVQRAQDTDAVEALLRGAIVDHKTDQSDNVTIKFAADKEQEQSK